MPWPKPGTELGSTHRGVSPVRVCALTAAPCGDEEPHELGMVGPHGHHQRGLLKGLVAGVERGARREQRLHGVEAAHLRRHHQRRVAGAVGRVGVGAAFEQQLHHRGVAARRRERHRRDAVTGDELGIGAGAQERARGVEIVDADRPVERGRAVAPRRVHVHTLLLQQGADRRHVPRHGGVGQARVAIGGARRGRHAERQQQAGNRRDAQADTRSRHATYPGPRCRQADVTLSIIRHLVGWRQRAAVPAAQVSLKEQGG